MPEGHIQDRPRSAHFISVYRSTVRSGITYSEVFMLCLVKNTNVKLVMRIICHA